ncbi:MAG: hypothetical protein JW958_04280 [Candidatus Eisenbacteria bacterium]|nr:hypothetical protein [Candidatus Eisenbacteria bacterium]
MRRIVFPLLILLAHGSIVAASDPEPVIVHGMNQVEYSVNSDAERDSLIPKEIFEDWLELDLRFDMVRIGFRYEAFQPHELAADSVREGFVHRFAEIDFGRGGVRAGTFYGIFGRGLLFRSYEDRNVRIDNDMDGIWLHGNVGPLAAKAFSGRMREVETDERSDVLRGVDLEADLPAGFTAGGSYLLQSSRNPNVNEYVPPPEPAHAEAYSGRAGYTHRLGDLYYEGGRINRLYVSPLDSRIRALDYDDVRGTGHYAAASVYPLDGLALTGEYKRYERFRFQPQGSSGTDYNNPPALVRETAYTLMTRHPHEMNADDEEGFQIEAIYTPVWSTTLTLNRAETDDLSGGPLFHEWYGEWRQEIGEQWIVALAYDHIEQEAGGGEADEYRTPALEVEYFPGGEWSLRGEYQFQESDTRSGITRDHFALLEYHPNMEFAFSVVGEHAQFLDPVADGAELRRDDYFYAQVDWTLSMNHRFSVMAGKRREGYICVGGVCRKEPEFQGVEMKLISNF